MSSFELFIPQKGGKGALGAFLPFLAAVPGCDWRTDEGGALWTVNDTRLLNLDFGLYPGDQMNAVLAVVELAVTHTAGSINIPGSIVYLSVRPVDFHHAMFCYDVRRDRSRDAEHREVVALIRDTAQGVLESFESIFQHLDAVAPPYPAHVAPPPGHGRNQLGAELLARVERVAAALTNWGAGRSRRTHG
ncbi:MAG: hypothetical protein KF745_02615 [Phycisphaeraceae bacterium]|nr:hypothetical protein [Phycisphaeraceae bacterium]